LLPLIQIQFMLSLRTVQVFIRHSTEPVKHYT